VIQVIGACAVGAALLAFYLGRVRGWWWTLFVLAAGLLVAGGVITRWVLAEMERVGTADGAAGMGVLVLLVVWGGVLTAVTVLTAFGVIRRRETRKQAAAAQLPPEPPAAPTGQ
jgi:hypothetical protein